MNRLLQAVTCMLILCAVVTSIGCSRTSPVDPTAKEIQACYDAMDQALAKKDVDAYLKPLAKEVKFQPLKGLPRNLEAIRTQTSDTIRAAGKIESTTRISECTVKDGQATVVVENKFKGDLEDSTGKHQVESTTTTRDIWRKSDQGWQLVTTTETASNTLKDGKPFASEAKK